MKAPQGWRERRSSKPRRSIYDIEETPSFVDPDFDKMEESDDSIVERVREHGRLY